MAPCTRRFVEVFVPDEQLNSYTQSKAHWFRYGREIELMLAIALLGPQVEDAPSRERLFVGLSARANKLLHHSVGRFSIRLIA